MIAVFKHEIRNYFHTMTAYVFGAFLLAFTGMGATLYNLQAAVSNFEFVLSFGSLIFVVIVGCVAVILALFAVKGISGVVVYNALVVVVSLIFPLPAALAINAVGTALCLSISYWIGRSTRTESLEGLLNKHPKLRKYFAATQEYGFVSCFAIHMLGLNMEVLGVLFGMMRLNYWSYLASSWLAIMPGMVCFCILGNNPDFRNPVFWALLIADGLLILGALWYTRHKLGQSSKRT